MTVLSRSQRRQLETAVRDAREIADEASKDALLRLGIADADAPSRLSDDDKLLRRRLRAHGRALGDKRNALGSMTTQWLQDAAAYEIWHRMLFGRFLVERKLLLHPDLGVAVSVDDLRELARDEGAADEWALAERYAAPALPGVFKPDDPVLLLKVAPEFSKRLRSILSHLDADIFTAEDSLGWTYQFWRASEKEATNEIGRKIGSRELPAVTQLFTEPFMVKFLLHNTLGAWWAGKILSQNTSLAQSAIDEASLRDACAIGGITWEYLRFVREGDGIGPWRPAAGIFPGWPAHAARITYCDPCCGSGHFLIEAFAILVALRVAQEELSTEQAAKAVLEENIYGLELDGRCVQIATFNVALAAWKLIGAASPLPTLHIAWVGEPPPLEREEFIALAADSPYDKAGMAALFDLFAPAPILGSLIETTDGDLASLPRLGGFAQSLDRLLERVSKTQPEFVEGAVAARGMVEAASILSSSYTLQATNVPFLGSANQGKEYSDFFDAKYPMSSLNLATVFVQRMLKMAARDGAVAFVSPTGWTFQSGNTQLRKHLILNETVNFLAPLGDGAFESASAGEAVCLCCLQHRQSSTRNNVLFIPVEGEKSPQRKACALATLDCTFFDQFQKSKNFLLRPMGHSEHGSLSEFAKSYQGLKTGDIKRFIFKFWELGSVSDNWELIRDSLSDAESSGCEQIVLWEKGVGRLHAYAREYRDSLHDMHESGQRGWGKEGVLLNAMGNLKAAPYFGEKFLSVCLITA
jgi:hypothetical protein